MKNIPDKFTLAIEQGKEGLWFITCPEVPGLLVAEEALVPALKDVVPQMYRLIAASKEVA